MLATVTLSWLVPGFSVIVRSTMATFWPKSLGPATCTLLTVTEAEEIRLLPLLSPLTMWSRNGSPTLVGTVIVLVYSFGAPVVRRYCCGPKMR